MSEPGNKTEKGAEDLEGFNLAVRAAEIIKNLVNSGISDLSRIAESIDVIMYRDQKIKSADVPNVSELSRPCTWNDFRDKRKARMNQPFEHFTIAGINPDGLSKIGCFKIIQDDCNDMLDALNNAETLTSPLVEDILFFISSVVGRYHYMCAYHGLEYPRQRSRVKGGSAPKTNAAILKAVKLFIMKHQKRIEQPNTAIAATFRRNHKSSESLVITIDSIEYEIYCDGERVCSSCVKGRKGKYHDKSISYRTFLTRYVPEAKNEIISPSST